MDREGVIRPERSPSAGVSTAKAAVKAPTAFYRFRLTPDGRVDLPFVSAGFTNSYGFPEGTPEDIAAHFFTGLHPDDAPRILEATLASARTLEPFRSDFRFRLPSGAWVWAEAQAVPERLEDGSVLWNGIVTDVTAQREAEASLRRAEGRFRAVLDSLQDAYFRTDLEGHILEMNQTAAVMYGVDSLDELVGHFSHEFFADPAERAVLLDEVRRKGAVRDWVGRARRKDGSTFWVSFNVSMWFDDAGNPGGSEGVARDITARKQAEDALRESRERYRALVETSFDWVWEVDAEGRYTYVSPRAADLLGYQPEEILGKTPFDLMPPEEATRVGGIFSGIAEARKPFRALLNVSLHKSGRRVVLETSGVPVLDAEGAYRGYRGTDRDVTERVEADLTLRRQEQLLRDAGETAHVGGWEFDVATMLGSWTAETARIHDLDPTEQIDPAKGFTFYAPESRPKIEAAVKATVENGTSYDLELELVSAAGRRKWIRTIGHPILENGKVVRVGGSFQDITDRKMADAALRASEERFRAMFEVAPMGVAQAEPATGRWTAVNPRFCEISGYDEAELLRMRVSELTHPDDRPRDWELFQRVVRGELPEYRIEKRYVRKDGSIAWVNVNMVVLRDDQGKPVRTLAMIEDITDRKRMVEALAASEARYRTLFETAAEGIVAIAPESMEILFSNPALHRMFGYTPEEFARLRLADLHPPAFAEAVRSDVEIAARGGKGPLEVVPCVRKDGTLFEADVRGSVVDLDGRKVTFGFFTDVTERAHATRRLTLQAEMGRILAEADSLATAIPGILRAVSESEGFRFSAWWEPDPETAALRCAHTWSAEPAKTAALEAATRKLVADPAESISGRAFVQRAAVHEPAISIAKGYARAAVAVEAGLRSAVAFPVLRAGEPVGVIEFFGTEIPALDPALVATVDTLGGQIAMYLERSRAQEETARYVAGNPAVLYALRISGGEYRVVWFSENIESFTGYSQAEIARAPERWWSESVHPEDRDRVQDAQRILPERETLSLEFRLRRKDGSWVWVRDEKRVLRDFRDRATEVVGSWTNVTDRVRLEEQLRQAQKMEAVGQLAGGVAHDFNNLLTVISGNSDLLLGQTPAGDERRAPLLDIRAAGERAAALTRQLLAFSRKQILEPKVVSLNDTVDAIEKMLRRLIGEDVTLVCDLSPETLWVKVDPGQLEQVVVNLAVNARDAMPSGGRLTIRTRPDAGGAVDLDETARRRRPHALLSIADTGVGMPADVKAHIFEPFFTTKAVGKGTGLGLATVYGIVKQSGGSIGVETAPGEGSTFTIALPVHPSPKSLSHSSSASARALPRGTETVLVVEDEDAVRRIVKIALESTGYRVIEARSGPEALEAGRRHPDRIDLLVTDVVMPEMSGRDLAERFVKEHPGIRVLYMSGYTDDAVVRHGVAGAGVAFLQKPFSPLALARKVREMLDAKA